MQLTEEQALELRKAVETVLKDILKRIEQSALTTPEDFEKVVSESLNDAYGEFLGPADPAVVKEVAERMAKLAKRR